LQASHSSTRSESESDNATGVDGKIFEGIKEAIAADRPAFLAAFLADFYNFDVLGGNRQCK